MAKSAVDFLEDDTPLFESAEDAFRSVSSGAIKEGRYSYKSPISFEYVGDENEGVRGDIPFDDSTDPRLAAKRGEIPVGKTFSYRGMVFKYGGPQVVNRSIEKTDIAAEPLVAGRTVGDKLASVLFGGGATAQAQESPAGSASDFLSSDSASDFLDPPKPSLAERAASVVKNVSGEMLSQAQFIPTSMEQVKKVMAPMPGQAGVSGILERAGERVESAIPREQIEDIQTNNPLSRRFPIANAAFQLPAALFLEQELKPSAFAMALPVA